MAVRLIIEDLEGATTVVNLGTEVVTIGRTPANTIQLTEQNVSRSHAKLAFRDDGWLLEDLSSYNGVRVNGVPIYGPTLLRESDLIQIGDYHLTLSDDVDRATVDIGPRAAANDGMGSSSELPSVSVDDLEPPGRSGGSAGLSEPHEDSDSRDSGSNAGVIAGVLGGLALLGVGIWWFTIGNQSGKTGADNKDQVADSTPAKTGDEPKPEQPTPGLEPSTGPGPDPNLAADSAATETGTETTGGAAAVAETETETGPDEPPVEPPVEPDPVPEPDKKPPKPKPPVEPKLPPDEALAAARKASLTGNNKQAYSLAKDAYDQNKSSEALSVMGVAACKMGSASKAKSAYAKMSDAKDKQTLEKICEPLGIELQ